LVLCVLAQIAELARTLDFLRQLGLELTLEAGNLLFEPLEKPLFHRRKRQSVPLPWHACRPWPWSRADSTSSSEPIALSRGDDTRALIDGWHLLHDAVAAGMAIDTVALAGRPPTASDDALMRGLGSHVVEVNASVMDALSPVRSPSGVVAIVMKRTWPFQALFAHAPALVVIVDGVQDPGNVGAIIRAAEAGGASGVVLTGASADPWGWKALRAAMGSTFRVPVVVDADPIAVCDRLREAGVRVLATTPRDGTSMYDADLREPVAIAIGSEGAGLSVALTERADARLTIPMTAGVESLNAAVAAALAVYEVRRQRMRS
jgi:TrmH family RNA methyltransferase